MRSHTRAAWNLLSTSLAGRLLKKERLTYLDWNDGNVKTLSVAPVIGLPVNCGSGTAKTGYASGTSLLDKNKDNVSVM